jgi:hypothetical protein
MMKFKPQKLSLDIEMTTELRTIYYALNNPKYSRYSKNGTLKGIKMPPV